MKDYRLPKEFADKWLAALRSGKYKQGKEALKDHKGRYCCLGVACEIAGHNLDEDGKGEFGFIGSAYKNPKTPREISMDDDDGEDLPGKLAYMNDSGRTFDEIANWIEDNVEFYV